MKKATKKHSPTRIKIKPLPKQKQPLQRRWGLAARLEHPRIKGKQQKRK